MSGTGFMTTGMDVQTGMTALAGGAAPTAAANTCVYGLNTVSTVATAGDSLILPAGIPQFGRVVVANLSAAKLDIFPNTGGTINAAAANNELGIAAITTAEFIQVGTDGLTWVATGVSAKQS